MPTKKKAKKPSRAKQKATLPHLLIVSVVVLVAFAIVATLMRNRPLADNGFSPLSFRPNQPIALSSRQQRSVAECFDDYLHSKYLRVWRDEQKGQSPLEGEGQTMVDAAMRNNFNPAIMLAIFGAETTYLTDPAAAPLKRANNPGSVTTNDPADPAIKIGQNPLRFKRYPNIQAAIFDWADIFRNQFLDKGDTTILKIRGHYCTKNCSSWTPTVTAVLAELQSEPKCRPLFYVSSPSST